jgi:hypothetical protein
VNAFLALFEPVTPVIVKVVGPPTPEVSVADVILDALGLTGVLLIGSALFGLALGGAIIWFKVHRPIAAFGGESSSDYRLDLSNPVSR